MHVKIALRIVSYKFVKLSGRQERRQELHREVPVDRTRKLRRTEAAGERQSVRERTTRPARARRTERRWWTSQRQRTKRNWLLSRSRMNWQKVADEKPEKNDFDRESRTDQPHYHPCWRYPLTYDLDFQSLASCSHDPYTCKKWRLNVRRFKSYAGNGRTDTTNCITFPANMVGNYCRGEYVVINLKVCQCEEVAKSWSMCSLIHVMYQLASLRVLMVDIMCSLVCLCILN